MCFFLTHIKYIFKQTYKRTLYKLIFSDQGTNNIDSNARANATRRLIEYLHKFATVYPAIYCRKPDVITYRLFSLVDNRIYAAGKRFYASGSRWTYWRNKVQVMFTVFLKGNVNSAFEWG